MVWGDPRRRRSGFGSGEKGESTRPEPAGYKHGSLITHILNRLQTDAQKNPEIPYKMARLEIEFNPILSSFKS